MHSNISRQQVRRVLIVTLVLNLTVAFGKIAIGIISGALAITADGFHSIIDGTSNVIGLVATRIADQPPDDNHPYGHRRFETLAALLIGTFLILAAWEITTGAIDRLSSGDHPELRPVTFAVVIATLMVNLGVSTYQIREGKRLRSEILLADASNTRSDVFVTLSVLVSMVVVSLTGWWWVDVLAALVVVVLIGRAAWQILRTTGSVLVDTAPYSQQELETALGDVPSVKQIVRARSRGSADAAYIDIDVQVVPEMTADHTAAIAGTIRERLEDQLSGVAEVEVHFMPDNSGERDYALVARAAADALGLATHEVRVINCCGRQVMEMHVEVPPGQSLDEAHRLVSLLERSVHGQLPQIDEVLTHIEPAQVQVVEDNGIAQKQRIALENAALSLLRQRYPQVNWHHIRLYDHEGDTILTLHAGLEPDVTLEAAHAMAEDAETLLRAQIPHLQRVTIHTEPHKL